MPACDHQSITPIHSMPNRAMCDDCDVLFIHADDVLNLAKTWPGRERNIRIATLVEAAGLVCVHCLNGEELGYRPGERPAGATETLTTHPFFHWTQWDYEDACYAYAIHAEMLREWGKQ